MKKWIAAALCALMLMLSAGALAAGNVTIAVQGQNDFNDYVSTMFAWDGRLLMISWNAIYVWKPGDTGLTKVEGYQDLNNTIYNSQKMNEDGTSSIMLGESELELEEGESISMSDRVVAAGDKLYRMMSVYGEEGVSRTLMVEIQIADDGALSIGGFIDLEDAMRIDYGDGYAGERDMQTPCYYDGVIYCLSYGEDGREMLAIDLENATVEPLSLDTDSEITGLSPFTAGKLLMVQTDYNTQDGLTSLMAYDIESEELTNLGELPRIGWDVPTAITYDEGRGMLYYVLQGSVWRMAVGEDGLGEPEEFGDMPLDIYSNSTGVLLEDWYILSSYDGIIGRNVTLEKLPEQKMRICNLAYLDPLKKAYFPFTDAHPEYMVSISDGTNVDLVQDMMNRSSDVDIYALSVSDSAYSALMSRGFLAELGGSEKLSAAVNAMYESLQNVVKKDGEIYAVPMNMYVSCYGINTKLLTEKLGYDTVPDNWVDLFGLLADLAENKVLEEYPEVSLLGPGYIERDVKYNLFMAMMRAYYLWLDQSEENLAAGGEKLLALCEAFEAIDWSAFGLPTEYEDNEGGWEYNEENILIVENSLQASHYYSGTETMKLALMPGDTPMFGAQVNVAFINPFSEHREAALEYLETAMDLVEASMRISMMPEENEPIVSPWYEENLKYYDDNIASLEKQLAEDDIDEESRDALTQQLEDMKKWREEYERDGRWQVSAEDIETYRKYAMYVTPAMSSVWGDDTYSQVSQYMDGAITAKQLCMELEKTLQMKRMEGQ